MAGHDRPRPRFEEQAALDELERLRQALEESRQRRKQAGEAFDTFLRSFKASPETPAPAATPSTIEAVFAPEPEPPPEPAAVALPPAPEPVAVALPPDPEPVAAPPPQVAEADVASVPPVQEPPLQTVLERLAAGLPQAVVPDPLAADTWPVEEPVPVAVDRSPARGRMGERVVPAALKPPRPPRSRAIPRGAAGGVVLLLAVAAFFTLRTRSLDPAEAPPAARQPAAQPAAPPAAPAATAGQTAQGPAQSAVPTDGVTAEIITDRVVWVRVLVDGEKALERELPPNTRMTFTARRTIVIRAGDAGGLRVVVGGRDQGPLGADGMIATRTFTSPR